MSELQTPAERIAQLESELAEAKALLSDREEWLNIQDAIIGGMLHKERAKDPQELRTLTFRERHTSLPPTTGVGAHFALDTRDGLEGFGAILARRKAEAALAQNNEQGEQKAA